MQRFNELVRPVRSPGVAQRAMHLAVLTSFALAQPLLDILGRNATFFAVRGSSSREIVLFAITLIVVPPAVLLLLELGAFALDPILGNALHLFFVAALTAIIALEAIKDLDRSSTVLVLGAALLGVAGAVLYWRAHFVRTFLTVLAPAPLVFFVLFLGNSQVTHLVFPKDVSVHTAKVKSRTPIVFIMFDEFSTTSLMGGNERIDAGRFPNFAALARDSVWFRSATTANGHTEVAVPAILAGHLPAGQPLPIVADYPHNIFTLLGGDYRLRVMESLTHLCPQSLCKTRVAASTEEAGATVSGSLHALASDVGIVYLHLLLPDGLAAHVPPTEDRWGNFGGHERATQASGETQEAGPCGRNICGFVRTISANPRPTFYFLHSILPHAPWAYLPSGKQYTGNVRVTPGIEQGGLWRDDDWLTLQGYQRYLLQLGDADAGLGLILKRLRSTGLYDRALVVVTADEGISFQPGEPARNLTRANLPDIAFVPLFVKLPGQRKPRIEDGLARTISILPTIAHGVHARIPWPVDGRSLLGAPLPRDGTVSLPDQSGNPISAPLSTLLAERKRTLARQFAAFGSGSIEQVYRFGPHRDLVGRRTAGLSVEQRRNVRFKLDGSELLRSVDPKSEVVPAYLTGRIDGDLEANSELAVAVNGAIAATTRTYEDSGATRFAAIIPDRLLRAGENDVQLYALRPRGGSVVLDELAGGNPTFVLRQRNGGEVIESSAGQSVRVVPGALRGRVGAGTPGGQVVFNGSAVDVDAGVAPDSIIVFVDGRSAYVSPANNAKHHGKERAGFHFEIPRRLLPKSGEANRIRVFAIRGGVASELRYSGYYLTVGRG